VVPAAERYAERPEEVGIDSHRLRALFECAARTVADRPLSAAQVAVARGGRLAGFASFGSARFGGAAAPADERSLFCVFSVTKALVSAACWLLLQEGELGLDEAVADAIPEFAPHGKRAVRVEHLLTHTAGFPKAQLDPLEWDRRERRLARFSEWRLDWEPGTRFTYHGNSSMWVLAELIERRSGTDFRDFVRDRITGPLGLADLHLGLPRAENARVAEVVLVGDPLSKAEREASGLRPPDVSEDLLRVNRPEVRAVGMPGGGAIATAAEVALFYQALLADAARSGGPGIWDPGVLERAWAPRTGDLIDPITGRPALWGLGVVVAGEKDRAWRGFAETCSARAIGHMGAGGQVSWADPTTGLSFASCTNAADRNPYRQGIVGFQLSTLAAACPAG
jgi:CubicO group peptidase (beta-lactamase class C family)